MCRGERWSVRTLGDKIDHRPVRTEGPVSKALRSLQSRSWPADQSPPDPVVRDPASRRQAESVGPRDGLRVPESVSPRYNADNTEVSIPDAITVSPDALALLNLHFSRQSLIVGGANLESLPGRSVEETKTAYRELVVAGLMLPMHSFVGGPESVYRLTDDAKLRKDELIALASLSPLPQYRPP
jgi:hypothetical protein